MATAPLQAEPAPANPALLTLHSAALAFEEIETDLAELSALVFFASKAAPDQLEGKALRAIVTRLDDLAAVAGKHSDAFLDANRAARAAMQ